MIRRTVPLSLLALCACSSSDMSMSQLAGPAPTPAAASAGAAAAIQPAGTTPAAVSRAAAAGSGAVVGSVNPGAVPVQTVPGGATPAAGQTIPGAAVQPADAAACRGFPVEGLIYSPGGDVLPNKCMPFHATLNNPYAVRCVDAWPWYKTKFPGDDFCILPPPPDKGVQYGVHPQGKKWFEQVSKADLSGYDNLTSEWIMEDGEEEQVNYQTAAENPMQANYYRAYARMRPGSHHMIVSSEMSGTMEKWAPGGPGLGALQLPGAQRPDENTPKSLEKPAEDKGLYNRLPAKAPVVFNMHHFNAQGKQILKEAWTNLWWETDATIELKPIFGLELGQTAGLSVQPGQVVDLHYSWNVSNGFRWVTAFGHRHAWTSNFTAWLENPDGKLDIVYQSLNWLDEPTYRYDSVAINPVPDSTKKVDGGASGLLMVKSGQKIHFNCHIVYTDARAAQEKAPRPMQNGPLHFANEAFTAEMCILFGSTTNVQLVGPQKDTSKLPPFAVTE